MTPQQILDMNPVQFHEFTQNLPNEQETTITPCITTPSGARGIFQENEE